MTLLRACRGTADQGRKSESHDENQRAHVFASEIYAPSGRRRIMVGAHYRRVGGLSQAANDLEARFF